MNTSDQTHIHFGGFTFEADTLVLRQGAEVMPLKRQSAQVLGLLIASAGEVVTRDHIRDTIWHDRTIEFDHGINACIRDIRRVLRDRSKDPLYVETLPKVGYRFIGSISEPYDDSTKPLAPRMIVGALIALTLLVAGLFAFMDDAETKFTEGERIAIMPFRHADQEGETSPELLALSRRAVTLLSEDQQILKVVSVAELFGDKAQAPGMGDVSRWLEVDYIVAGAISESGDARTLNIRLIRTDGYVHLWSKSVIITDDDGRTLDALMAELIQLIDPDLPPAPE
jgi:DNA-binding winged helix-turn-helix (wHTH) protein/TolB-like protein